MQYSHRFRCQYLGRRRSCRLKCFAWGSGCPAVSSSRPFYSENALENGENSRQRSTTTFTQKGNNNLTSYVFCREVRTPTPLPISLYSAHFVLQPERDSYTTPLSGKRQNLLRIVTSSSKQTVVRFSRITPKPAYFPIFFLELKRVKAGIIE